MMDSVGKPYLFQIFFECFEVATFFIAFILRVYGFERAAYGQIPFSVLIEKNVPSLQGSFGEIINEFFLSEGKTFESRYPIPKYFQVGKLFYRVTEIFGLRLGIFFVGTSRKKRCSNHNEDKFFHHCCFIWGKECRLFNIKYQPFEILPLGMVNVYGVIGRLRQLVQDTDFPPGLRRSTEYGQTEIVFTHNL